MPAWKHILQSLCVGVAAAGIASAQSSASAQQTRAPDARFRESVSLETDSSVAKRLGSVRDYVADEKWDQAIEIISQTAAAHPETLIAASPGRYLNVPLYCNMLLTSLPPEGLAVYRAKIDPLARQWFETGESQWDAAVLRKVVRQAFASSFGDDALLLLGEMAWDRGEIAVARSYWSQLIPPADPVVPGNPRPVLRYPDTNHDPASILARLVLCSVFEGNVPRAEREQREFKRMFPSAEGALAGRNGNLATILEAVTVESRQWTRPARNASFKTFALDVRRNLILPRSVDVGAPRWSVPLPVRRFSMPKRRAALKERGPLSYYPVLFGDVVLVNDAERIFAWNLHTGQPAWPVNADDNAVIRSEPTELTIPRSDRLYVGVPRYTMTVHEGRLYAKMGTPVTARSRLSPVPSTSHLVCLDLAGGQGKLVWSVSTRDGPLHETGWAFEGSPVVWEGRVYVALRRSQPQTQLNVACYDAETGKPIWNRKVCAALANVGDTHDFISHLLLTFAQETLFFSTDVGAIAALEARDGTLRWVATYESDRPRNLADLSDHRKQGLTPCLFHQGTVFAAPNDTDTVMAIDGKSGIIAWRRKLPDRIRHLLGVSHGRLIVSGDSLWGLDAETGRQVWGSPERDPEFFGYGRGLLAGNTLWWPTRDRIHIVDPRTGRPVDRQPINLTAKGAAGGHLMIAEGSLLIAGPDRLIVFSEYGRRNQGKRKKEKGKSIPFDFVLLP